MTGLFYSGVAVVAALLAVTRSSATQATLYLAVTLVSAGLIFLSLGAPFAAALEILVYTGAMVTYRRNIAAQPISS